MKFRESVEPATGWIDSTIIHQIKAMGEMPGVDRRRVTEAMHYGWRYNERDGVGAETYLALLQTSAWFNIDADVLGGMLGGDDPTMPELPPVPFPRIALDATWNGKRAPLFGITLRREGTSASNEFADSLLYLDDVHTVSDEVRDDPNSITLGLASMTIQEIQQGLMWDVCVTLHYLDAASRGRPGEIMGYHLTWNQHLADYDGWRKYKMWGWDEKESDEIVKFDQELGHLIWKAAVLSVHLITATNVRNVRTLPKRKQTREWKRMRFGPVEPRIYRVNIMSENKVRTSGATDREYHVRWMVRGHYRRTANGQYKHPQDGSPASWVRPYIKGPAGAPWKGRPYHIREGEPV